MNLSIRFSVSYPLEVVSTNPRSPLYPFYPCYPFYPRYPCLLRRGNGVQEEQAQNMKTSERSLTLVRVGPVMRRSPRAWKKL